MAFTGREPAVKLVSCSTSCLSNCVTMHRAMPKPRTRTLLQCCGCELPFLVFSKYCKLIEEQELPSVACIGPLQLCPETFTTTITACPTSVLAPCMCGCPSNTECDEATPTTASLTPGNWCRGQCCFRSSTVGVGSNGVRTSECYIGLVGSFETITSVSIPLEQLTRLRSNISISNGAFNQIGD
jgi:hypothetical protein